MPAGRASLRGFSACRVTPPKWHPPLVLREPDIEGEAELRFVQSHGAVLLKLRRALVRMGLSGARRIPGWEIGLDTCLNKSVL